MPRRISEEATRKQMNCPLFVDGIDSQLEQAGWYLRVNAVRDLQSETREELDALLPFAG